MVSKSYPFLSLARIHNLPYGVVLSYADAVRRADSKPRTAFSFWEVQALREVRTQLAGAANSFHIEVSGQLAKL